MSIVYINGIPHQVTDTLQRVYEGGNAIVTSDAYGSVTISGTEGLQILTDLDFHIQNNLVIDGYLEINKTDATTAAIINHSGTGIGIDLNVTNPGSNASALDITYDGNQNAIRIVTSDTNNGSIFIDHDSSSGHAAIAMTVNEGPAIEASVDSDIYQGIALNMNSATAAGTGMTIQHAGLGEGMNVNLTNASNTASGLNITHAGTGIGLDLNLTNASSSGTGLDLSYAGQGIAFNLSSAGINPALSINNTGGDVAIQATTASSSGTTIQATAANNAAYRGTNNSATATSVLRNNNTTGPVLDLLGTTSGTLGVRVPNTITSYDLILPNAQGASDTVLRNDGSGSLTWVAANSFTTLQNAYNNDPDGGNVTITTNSTDGNVVIAGTQRFVVTATNGLQVAPASGSFTALEVTGSLNGHASMFTATGTAIAALYTSDSTTQPTAYFKNTNSGTGGNIWLVNTGNNRTNLKVSSSQSVNIDWVFPTTQGASDSVLRNDGSGNLSWVAANSFTTLQNAYKNDVDGSDATISTDSTDGHVVIGGTEGLRVTGSKGLVVASTSSATGDLITSPAVGDIYATGRLEVDGEVRFDSTVTTSIGLSIPSTFGVENTTAASTLNIGSSGNTSTLNLGTGSNTNVINVGTGAGTTTINLGGAGDTVNISGTLTYVNTTNLEVTDKLIIINKNGAVASGDASGIAIEEDGILEGYAYVGNSRASWDFVAPASEGTFRLTPDDGYISTLNTAALTDNRIYTFPDESGDVWIGAKALSDLSDVDDTLAPGTNDILHYDGVEWTSTNTPTFSTLDVTGVLSKGTSGSQVEEEYFHSITLTASQTNTTASTLTFSSASFEGVIVQYKIKEATTGNVRVGQMFVSTDGTTADVADTYGETADVGVSWIATMNGTDVELQYTTTANDKTMRADVKRIPV